MGNGPRKDGKVFRPWCKSDLEWREKRVKVGGSESCADSQVSLSRLSENVWVSVQVSSHRSPLSQEQTLLNVPAPLWCWLGTAPRKQSQRKHGDGFHSTVTEALVQLWLPYLDICRPNLIARNRYKMHTTRYKIEKLYSLFKNIIKNVNITTAKQ